MTLTTIKQTITTLKLKAHGLREVSCQLWKLEDFAAQGWNISAQLDDGTTFNTDDLHSESIDDSYHWIVDGDSVYRQWRVGLSNLYITDLTQVRAIEMVRA